MQFIRNILAQALCLPSYRDWSVTWVIVKARVVLMALLGFLAVLLAPISLPGFGLVFSLLLGLALGTTLDFFFAGGLEGFRQFRRAVLGPEATEIRRLEELALMESARGALQPRFMRGLKGGLWLELSQLEAVLGQRIGRAVAVEKAGAVQNGKSLWIAVANCPNLTTGEGVGRQLITSWLRNTALPHWQTLEREAREG